MRGHGRKKGTDLYDQKTGTEPRRKRREGEEQKEKGQPTQPTLHHS